MWISDSTMYVIFWYLYLKLLVLSQKMSMRHIFHIDQCIIGSVQISYTLLLSHLLIQNVMKWIDHGLDF